MLCTAVIVKCVPEIMVFPEIVRFFAAVPAGFRNIVVRRVVIFKIVIVATVAAGCVPAAGTASDITAERTGVTRESVRIIGDTKRRAAGGAGDVCKVDVRRTGHIQILPAAVAAGTVGKMTRCVTSLGSMGLAWQNLQRETERQQ
jgi:hypothetical protein